MKKLETKQMIAIMPGSHLQELRKLKQENMENVSFEGGIDYKIKEEGG